MSKKLHISYELFDLIYPVGSVYISVNNINPSILFGYGTWELINISSDGGILVQYDADNGYFDLPGQNHGSSYGPGSWSTHETTLTVNQIPAHTHGSKTLTGTITFRDANTSDHNTVLDATGITSFGKSKWSGTHAGLSTSQMSTYYYNNVTVKATHEHTSVGGGQGHRHLCVPPYMTVCMWKRVPDPED